MAGRKGSRDPDAVEEERQMYAVAGTTLDELDEQYPNRPQNSHITLPFAKLFQDLFDPLTENKAKPAARGGARVARSGVHGATKLSPHEQRRKIIERFISNWRNEVGDDFYPALRLILPDQDRDRGVYGLKENAIAKLLVKLMKIDKNSEDGFNLLNWKLPGKTAASRVAGDFAGRCYEVLAKRPMRTEVGDMRIGEVNVLLDTLAMASGEAEQLPILDTFYQRMNAKELMWLVRIILKQMKVGATGHTFLNLWHRHGEALFSKSSSLRRVCWELYKPDVSLDGETMDGAVVSATLMSCFQPQLAQFQVQTSFGKVVEKLLRSNIGRTEDDDDRKKYDPEEYWIEEKLDGERMQMHMVEDSSVPGGKKFAFWSRKAKDYTDMYGHGLQDDNSCLTRHLKDAFVPEVFNLILDGEMIEWDPQTNKAVTFGTLKTAALAGQRNPHDEKATRPVFRVFDILYLNDTPLVNMVLHERREALEGAIKDVPHRLEIHPITRSTNPNDIEPQLRTIIENASEGLVLKNPMSAYRLNNRNDDWIKVKPEYMTEHGEDFDCVVIGGYYGSGRRGGALSSFLCGVRVSANYVKAGADPEKCLSFFKVGGGFKAADYATIRHQTEGKWVDWDSKKPPSQYIELGGGERYQYEKPDVWIRPSQSIVLSVKAASLTESDQFATAKTLRFPRFKRLPDDRAWDSALSVDELEAKSNKIDETAKEKKEMTMMERRSKRQMKKPKRELELAGQDPNAPLFEVPTQVKGNLFEGLTFFVASEMLNPSKKSKNELQELIKAHGGELTQNTGKDLESGRIVIGERPILKVKSAMNAGFNVVKPIWLFDCVAQSEGEGDGFLLPYEPRHLYHATEETAVAAEGTCDMFGDSYARDIDIEELRELIDGMPKKEDITRSMGQTTEEDFLDELEARGRPLGPFRSSIFRGCHVLFAATSRGVDLDCPTTGDNVRNLKTFRLENLVRYGSGTTSETIEDSEITHVVVVADDETPVRELAAAIRARISSRRKLPRVVLGSWVEDSFTESTRVDEEAYAPPP